jgi:hypothetical protein
VGQVYTNTAVLQPEWLLGYFVYVDQRRASGESQLGPQPGFPARLAVAPAATGPQRSVEEQRGEPSASLDAAVIGSRRAVCERKAADRPATLVRGSNSWFLPLILPHSDSLFSRVEAVKCWHSGRRAKLNMSDLSIESWGLLCTWACQPLQQLSCSHPSCPRTRPTTN